MRRLGPFIGNERGGISVMVAILMVVLLGFAALAVDVGVLYSERAQLQNGADAAALSVAQRCATNLADPGCSATSPLASDLANENALDRMSNIKSITLNTGARTVSVTVGARETGSAPNSVSLFFANVLGFPSAAVNAKTSVKWGSPVKGTAPFPVTVSICQVRDQSGVMQRLQLHGNNANPDCYYGPSGAFVQGGFGGLKQDTNACGATVDTVSNTAGGDTGNNPTPNCEGTLNSWAADMNSGKAVILLLPIFNAVTGTGTGAVYRLTTFAAFKIAGWKLGNPGLPYTFRNRSPDVPSALECREPCRGIIGTFVKYVSLADGYELGAVDPDGVTVVELKS
ncbi:TadE/TadG family type IV pilus assembly protein [Arthrobacter sp. ISL-28]|uniref:TadE/TadG family type IV pilus assembly protein n=1 Tax=Arthrobacter sp. ISL-28 TaxID=2819108 RepID=UPI001BEA28E4|nr:TadE/TadG family type IV pilus assembly protein [Arthrobacter sp. ISL-28]MBT2521301.1 Tad domain-containing protein [Arthrobacter sp. ISL-28]